MSPAIQALIERGQAAVEAMGGAAADDVSAHARAHAPLPPALRQLLSLCLACGDVLLCDPLCA